MDVNMDHQYQYTLHFDGGSRGNPGIGGAGAVITMDHATEIWSGGKFLGKHVTNNQAEYSGLILGLEYAIQMGITRLYVCGDSQLIIRQMTGRYKCGSPHLVELYGRAKALEAMFERIEYKHVPRAHNARADKMANAAMDEAKLE